MASPQVQKLRQLRLITAIKTPFTLDGNLDLGTFDSLCRHQVEQGVDAVIIGGTTGEGHLFSWEEHLLLITHARARFGDRVVIIGNTGSNCTAEAAYATKKGFAIGMDCALIINPYYGKTSARGIVMHLEHGMGFGPCIVYNVPGRTCQDINPDIMMQIKDHKNFVGVKECMGNERIKQLAAAGIACWSGNDDECFLARHDCGAVGVISVTSNIVPGLMKELMYGARNDALDEKLKPLYAWLFTDPNPIGVNTMLMQLGVVKPVFRLPYTYCSRELRQQCVKIIEQIGRQHMPGSSPAQVMEDSDFVHVLNGDA